MVGGFGNVMGLPYVAGQLIYLRICEERGAVKRVRSCKISGVERWNAELE